MKKNDIWLLSEKGILDINGKHLINSPFKNVSVVAGDVHEGNVAVIVDWHEVWTFVSGNWDKIISADTKLNTLCWTYDKRLLIGTEKARLAWVSDSKLAFIDSFDTVPERKFWKTPWGGPPDVRSLSASADGTLYANIHVGWIVCSTDNGKSWKSINNGLEIDVHQVSTHPSKPEIVFAATADGFYLSKDYGETFSHSNSGMPYCYQRACACFTEKDVYLVSTSRGPHGQADALVYRSENDGKTWEHVNGLPEKIKDNIDTYQIIVINGANAIIIVNNRDLYKTSNFGKNWEPLRQYQVSLYSALVVSID